MKSPRTVFGMDNQKKEINASNHTNGLSYNTNRYHIIQWY